MINSTKKCTVCQEEKPRSEFYKKYGPSASSGAKLSLCKKCYNRKKAQINKNSGKRERVLAFVRELKKEGCCMCEEKEFCCLQLHHLYPETKSRKISSLTSHSTLTRVKEELAKGMVVLCFNCHTKVHAGVISVPIEKAIKI